MSKYSKTSIHEDKSNFNKIIRLVFVLLLIVYGIPHAKAQFKCVINGTVTEDKKKLELAVITLYKGKTVVQQITTTSNGKFKFNLEPNAEYTISMTRPGYITKKIMYTTMGVSMVSAKNFDKIFYPEVDLFKMPKDPTLVSQINAIVAQPVGKLFYDISTDDIINDEAYAASMQSALANLKRLQEEAAKKEEEDNAKYKDAIDRGDAAFSKKDYATARTAFVEASAIKTFEVYPKNKIADCDKLLADAAGDAEKEAKYKAAIAKADGIFASKEYANAKSAYNDALAIKPNEKYPKDKIAECDKLLGDAAKAGELEEKYKAAIAKGDAAMTAKDYNAAKAAFNEALSYKAKEKYPTDKLAEIDKILADLAAADKANKALNEKYNALIAKADKALGEKSYVDAKTGYTAALALKPNEQYPKDKLAEVNALIEKDAGLKEVEAKYAAAIAKGDKAMSSKNYADAKAAYTEALTFKPEEQYPKDKLAEIAKILDKQLSEKQLEENYKAAIAKGDAALAAKNYTEAKASFNEALTLKPTEKYPKDKLAEIDKLLAAEMSAKELNDKYNAAIDKADGAFGKQDYTAAKAAYNEALGFKPAENYPKVKLAAIEKILADMDADKALTEKYNALIAKADKSLEGKKYTDAKGIYNDALKLKPNEQYPKDKIAEIDAILAKQMGEKQLEENYKAAVAKGDKAIETKDYTSAKAAFTDAKGLKPMEEYPKFKLEQLEDLMAKELAEKLLEENYKAALAKGDAAFGTKDYANAKAAYNEALTLKPKEKYPTDKIAEIDKLLAAEMSAKELDEKYNAAISKADAAFGTKDYTTARTEYNNAVGFKPAEKYPKDKIAEIDKLLADQEADKALTEKYNALIAKADKSLEGKKYTDAKGIYNDALKLKPNEQYPKDKIAEIDAILAKQMGEKQLEESYKAAVAKGDKAFEAKDYAASKAAFTEANGLKPMEEYPKFKLGLLEDLLAKEMAEKLLEEKYKAALAKGDAGLGTKDYTNAKAAYNEALTIKPKEKYPVDKIAEIDRLLAAEMSAKELDEKYNSAIAKADAAFGIKDYTTARTEYGNALGFKPAEKYPKDKIAEIDKILGDAAANKELNEKYKAAIEKADAAFAAKTLEAARASYSEASTLIPAEQYPKDKIAEIDAILAKNAADKKRDDNYKAAIAEADAAMLTKDYATAKADYTDANTLKPFEEYPKLKLQELEKLIAEELRNKEINDRYNSVIAKADAAFGSLEYQNAKTEYNNALLIKPEELYPKAKIAEIDRLLADIAAKEKAEKELTEKYNDLIARADKAFGTKTYAEAKAFYTQAARLKSAEQYPKDKIAEIDAILAKELADRLRDENYTKAIARGDAAMAAKDYVNARIGYSTASGLKPDEQYPKDKIAAIDAILEKERLAKKLDEDYKKALTAGNMAITMGDYESAKTGYKEANRLKPNEQYPKDQLAKIDKIIADLAREKLMKEKYNAAIAKADAAFSTKDYSNSLIAYKEAQTYRPNEYYPASRISDINRILDGLARLKEKEDRYNATIANADKLFVSKQYQKARSIYSDALLIKPTEQYPRDKMAEIDLLMRKTSSGGVPTVIKKEEIINDLAQRYPEGVTEEYATETNATLIRRIVVKGHEGHLYIQKTTKFGAVYWTRDGVPITEQEYIKKTEL